MLNIKSRLPYAMLIIVLALNITMFFNKPISAKLPAGYKLLMGSGCAKECGDPNDSNWYECETQGNECAFTACTCFNT